MIHGRLVIVATLQYYVRISCLSRAILPLSCERACTNCFHERQSYDLDCAILRVCNHRIDVRSLPRVSRSLCVSKINYSENSVIRVLRAISYLF